MAKIAVILSGSGVFDGSEIHESTITLMHLHKNNAEVITLAPNMNQHHVINHQEGTESEGIRNVLIESARIARGPVLDIRDANPADFDAVILPGGFGAAKNLCDFAFNGANAQLNEDILGFLKKAVSLKKPVGAMCIAPVILALLHRDAPFSHTPKLTIGKDKDTASAIEALKCTHEERNCDEICIDTENKLITTPAYMLGENPADIEPGIRKLVESVLEMSR
jgi:enhancing lycopene biosynthesis protein 2